MPQASCELRQWATDKFGDIDLKGPIDFLQERGFELLPNFTWKLPHVGYAPNVEETKALWFLVSEWDFGGIGGP
jgi:hypothetical protein